MTTKTIVTDDKNLAILVHVTGLLGFVIPLANLIAPLVIWLTKKETSPFVAEHAKNVLNFQLSMTIYFIACVIAMIILIGIPLFFILIILDVVWSIKGAIAASDAKEYSYPMSIKFF